MFFSLSTVQDPRFPEHDRLGRWWFSHDDGWTKTDSGWRKGYYHDDIDHGNYAELSLTNDVVSLLHDRYRSFPLWWDESKKILTNLLGTGSQIWADKIVKISGVDLQETTVDLIGTVDTDPASMSQVVEQLSENFAKKVNALPTLPFVDKKLFLTGGIDTLTIAAIIEREKQSVDYIDFNFFQFDWFTNHNMGDIRKKYWGYRNMHHWTEPCILITGGCGDEYFMRGPDTVALWAAWHDIDIVGYFQTHPRSYHTDYFLRSDNVKKLTEVYTQRAQIQEIYKNKSDLVREILNINANDHQHWHLGKTIHWTPFKDLDLLKIILRLDVDDMLTQILDARVNRRMIEASCPILSKTLSDSKNTDHRKNLNLLI